MTALPYPTALEEWWLGQWRLRLAREPDADDVQRLEQTIARLSDGFTTTRTAAFGSYASSPAALIAYGLFFFPQTFVRMRFILREVFQRHRAPDPATPFRILDLGAGTGAAGLALLTELGPTRQGPVELVAVDQSPASLQLLQKLFSNLAPLWPQATLKTREGDASLGNTPTPGPWNMILVSYALNELLAAQPGFDAQAWTARLVQALTPDGCLVICEPIVKDSPLRLEQLRDGILKSGLARVVAPCLHQQPCPMRPRDEEWCHDVRRWQPPASLQFLNRHLFRSIEVLKYSFLALAPAGQAEPAGDASCVRIVSPVHEPKGKIGFRGCAADGALHLYETLARHVTGEERTAMLALERGDRVRCGELEALRDGRTLRVRRVTRQDTAPEP